MSTNRRPFQRVAFLMVISAAVCAGVACSAPVPDGPPPIVGPSAEQQAFWATLRSHCGKAFPGSVDDTTEYYRAGLEGRVLVAHFRECTDDRIHIALHENDDRSRNWILTWADNTLRLKHDHRHEDGTEDQISQYGGDAPLPGLPNRQIFKADAHTASILPLRADNFWFMHFVNDTTFHYGVHWPTMGHSVRLSFDLSRPIEPPPAPWGYGAQGLKPLG